MFNKLKISLAIGTLVVAAGLSPVMAQQTPAPATPAPGSVQQPAPSPESNNAAGEAVAAFTPDTVDPANPFGEIDVSTAGTTEEEATTFFNGLTAEQQSEISGRCAVILNPVHQERYAEEMPSTLCRNLVAAGLVDEPAA